MTKKIKYYPFVGLAVLVFCLLFSTAVLASAADRYGVYFNRNYGTDSLAPGEIKMAEKEFSNPQAPYTAYKIMDADQSKQAVIAGLDSVFSHAKADDVNYLLMSAHGEKDGILDFTFAELRTLLDRYQGHFVIVLDACQSGGLIQRAEMARNFVNTFEPPKVQTRSGEFMNSKYNVFAACSKDQDSYMTEDYGFFMKSYFDSSQVGANGYLNADANHDQNVSITELDQYLATYGKMLDATPVSQIVDQNLTVFSTAGEKPVAMYRLYNPNSSEHFYTRNSNERDQLKQVGWQDEGIGWYAPETGTGTPVYRLYNPNAGDHHYTLNSGERDLLKTLGWQNEGIGWYSKGSVPLYRQYNPNAKAGAHNYTTNKAENDLLVGVGWQAEGIGWYAIAQ